MKTKEGSALQVGLNPLAGGELEHLVLGLKRLSQDCGHTTLGVALWRQEFVRGGLVKHSDIINSLLGDPVKLFVCLLLRSEDVFLLPRLALTLVKAVNNCPVPESDLEVATQIAQDV